MECGILQRITKYCRKSDLSNNKLSVLIGIGQKTVNNYMNGSRKVSYEFVEAIARTFEDINSEWLLTGKGEMIKSDSISGDSISLIEELKAENNQLKGENRILREQAGLGERKELSEKSA